MPQHKRRRWITGRVVAIGGCASLLGTFVLAAQAAPGAAATRAEPAHVLTDTACHLGNGVKHVIEVMFDNVHFFRDNPDVPSDMQMLPDLTHFLEGNGTLLSNNHTPLIAHTADDLLTTLTGLYGDRQGMPIANDYQAYNKNGTTDPASSFAYWTDKVDDTASSPTPGHDTNPNQVYSPTPPATTFPHPKPDKTTPAPWVPFTRAGCNYGAASTVNVELENPTPDIAKVFGKNSPEEKQLEADDDPYKDAEIGDYIGVAVHCAKGQAFCKDAEAVKYGETKPTHTAVPDLLPDEPGGYTGYQALFGHRYVAPQLGAGKPNLMHNGYRVTNAAGNLVDLNGNQMNDPYTGKPGFPGFDNITPSQTLAYMADMLENGVPVVTGYISDLHGNHNLPQTPACKTAPGALASGTLCYIEQARYWNQAFGIFFKRLAADGITPKNSLFIFSSDEGDHEAGANVGRAVQPTPTGCDGAKVVGDTIKTGVLCNYTSKTFGELDGNLTGLIDKTGNKTSWSLEADTAPEFYVTGQPGPYTKSVRSLEHAVASLKAANPYTKTTQPITNYIADPTEEAILHMVNADPRRTPTFALFAKPDYYLQTGSSTCSKSSPCVTQDDSYAWDHGDYAAEINTNWVAFAGPGVKHLGLDGSPPAKGPNSAGADSGQVTVPDEHTTGPWVDETDIRPTIMYLTGLKDDYQQDGRVITQILSHPNSALSAKGVTPLGECYKQLNSSVGDFGTATLQAATKAVEGSSNAAYKAMDKKLFSLDVARDKLAGEIKGDLGAAAFENTPVPNPSGLTASCQSQIKAAEALVGS